MIWLTNKYVQFLLLIIITLPLGYYKGYSDKATTVELQNYEDFKKVISKIDEVYNYSVEQTTNSKNYVIATNSRLNSILKEIGKIPLTSTPCEPTEEFTLKWNQLNDATINK